jgi:predicted nuclease of restriction endonuclease-like (RecB) superfamily
MPKEILPPGYDEFLRSVKEQVQQAQIKAAVSVNRELILLYWRIGHDISNRIQTHKWGAKVIEHLAKDLSHEFPDIKGFSPRNLKYMRAFAEAYPDEAIVPQLVAQIPWGHHRAILDKIDNSDERLWYIKASLQHGWSRNILIHQIELRLYQRQGQAVTNFDHSLPPLQSELAQATLKDPYIFDFLSLGKEALERELENALLVHLRDFLLELGVGFAFLGNQYHLEVGGEDFYIDLLFYHVRLHCYVVIDLKIGDFQPEFAGKMNFYLAAVDDIVRQAGDQPSIGIILCKKQNKVVAEYALKDIHSPMGIATYQLTELLPDILKGSLPEIKDLESTLSEQEEPHHTKE